MSVCKKAPKRIKDIGIMASVSYGTAEGTKHKIVNNKKGEPSTDYVTSVSDES